jgi:hypothetical protein
MSMMTVNRELTEIFDQIHQMYAEGTSDLRPTTTDINQLITECGFVPKNIDIFYDQFQAIWRWGCDISKK